MEIITFKISIEIPLERNTEKFNLVESLKDGELKSFKLNTYGNLIFFISDDENRFITLDPKNNISITFNPKTINDDVILKVEEEINMILNLVKKKYEYHHLHQEIQIHFKDIKLKFNPVSLLNEKDLNEKMGNKPFEVGIVGLNLSEDDGQIHTKITFYKTGGLIIKFTDLNSNSIDFIKHRNKVNEILTLILEK